MKIQIKKLLVFVAFITLAAGSVRAGLAEKIDEVVIGSSQRSVDYSVCVINAETGKTVYEYNAHEAIIPASNMKVITTAAALRYLGSNFEYKTKVGLKDGDLVVIGSGDPLFGDKINDKKYDRKDDWIFERIAKALKDNNAANIQNIIIDTGVFDNELVHSSWSRDELNRSYACEVCGLNYNVNCISMSLENEVGEVKISIEPSTSYITLINEVKINKNKDSAVAAYRTNQMNKLKITGICNSKVGPFEVAIEKPAAFFGVVLAEYLATHGIIVSGQLIEKESYDTKGFKQIAEFVTPITDCLERCNKDSLNFAAESLMKTISAYNNPDDRNGNWAHGAELIGSFLNELNIDGTEFSIDDGCGLSRNNKLSANALATVFLDLYRGSNWALFKSSLAIGGIEGTGPVANYFKDAKYKGKVFAKSGTITGVKALSGICVTGEGDYIFSIITNKANGGTRKAINTIVESIIDEAEDI